MKARNNGGASISFLPEQPQSIELVLRIQMISRFIEQIQIWRLCQYLSDRQPTPFTTGQGQDISTREIFKVDRCQGRRRNVDIRLRFPIQATDMWMATNQSCIDYGRWKNIVDVLRQ